MIKACKAVFLLEGKVLDLQNVVDSRVEWTEEGCSFRFEAKEDFTISEFFIDIEFVDQIVLWRYLDYTWKRPGNDRLVANVHSPKILKLQSGLNVAATGTSGCWEYQPGSGHLRWFFYHPMLSPTMVYDQIDQRIFLRKQQITKGTVINNGLIAGKGKAEEWARTPLGFVPVVCFTDHSDFDTKANLEVQRALFSSLGIKVTKGFFLYDYTHKAANASFESEESRQELIDWDNEGNELAYHALSQSYRGNKSEDEFKTFESPKEINPVTCYIDHGFHPYNYTKQKLGEWNSWYTHMSEKGIRLIWNYLDAGEGNLYTVNQLNPHGFTLNCLKKSSQYFNSKGKKRSPKNELRNFLMYGVPEDILRTSKFLKGSLGAVKSKPGFKSIRGLAGDLTSLAKRLLSPKTIKEINKRRIEIFEINRFGTVFFKACNQKETDIQVFQTLSVRDFDIVFSEEALNRLQDESGLMIAHTYFAYTGENHEGRLFKGDSDDLREEAKAGLERLGEKIQKGQIWNPKISELAGFFKKFESITYIKEGEDLKISCFDGIKRSIE
ncbi:hypothetical protein D0X99_19420 [Algoriphagus lacus]|uniref:Uncharacterized protein n=1 Tax=Algoriphagus lacus TaxID=2056311 RepID=A0A418PM05_9BACT|nr:hypothetical protein [Algoriphagus lacus]RIW12254.1 hypothetical protein D0X99_19420 [Algoriphagus lacus]